MAAPKKRQSGKKITRYAYAEIKEPRTPETGHTALLNEEEEVTLPMDNGWTDAIRLEKPEGEDKVGVVVDMDPAIDPVLLWAGKKSQREIPLLPLQRNEIISDSRIAQIVERARRAASETEPQQELDFGELEKALRESDKDRRIEFYTHDEDWRNKLICGDSLAVIESLLHYEGLRGRVQMIYVDPPYGIKYDSNFQQRVDSTKNDQRDHGDDVVSIKAFRDVWIDGIHSYLSYLRERLYLCRDLLAESGSVFVQIGDETAHLVRSALEEVFGSKNFVAEIVFFKTSGKGGAGLDSVYDRLIWYAKDRTRLKYNQLYMPRPEHTLREQYTLVEEADGTVRRITEDEKAGTAPLPDGARRFMPDQLSSQGESEGGSAPFEFQGTAYGLPPNTHWKTSQNGLERLATKDRLYPIGKRLRYKRYADDFPVAPYTNVWDDTVISGFASTKLYATQTSSKVVERCILMATDPADIVLDPTCGSGTTAFCAERTGRRWITCDTSRVAINIARMRLLSAIFPHFKTRNGLVSSGFEYRTIDHVTLKSLAYDMEPEQVELVDQPSVDTAALRVCGPFEVMTLGRYSAEDWKGYVSQDGELENYISVVCRLYRKEAGVQGASGLLHAIAESDSERIGISVGPITGRVTARQINDVVEDALAAGILEVHVLGWAFEANVGEVKSRLEARGRVKVELVMIRPDTLAEGLKVTQPDALFSPLALPDVQVENVDDHVAVSLRGVGVFDRKRRTTDYYRADSGYVAAWYLDEDYDGDCFVDSQMFFDFKKAPNLATLGNADLDASEFKLQLTARPFQAGHYRRFAVKVVDVYGNESTLVRELTD